MATCYQRNNAKREHFTDAKSATIILVLDRRARLGGTWDLFRYPGIRSDSDLHTYAYSFRPWSSPRVLCDGASIREYLADTARELRIEPHIRYGVEVVSADWSSPSQCWTLRTKDESLYLFVLRARARGSDA